MKIDNLSIRAKIWHALALTSPVLPVLSSVAATYLILPWINLSQGDDVFNTFVIVFSFFAAVSTFSLGMPMYLAKSVSQGRFDVVEQARFFLILAPCLLPVGVFLLRPEPTFTHLLLFVPLIGLLSLVRGVSEGKKRFFISSILRVLTTFLLPILVLICFQWLGGSDLAFSVLVALLTLIYLLIFSNRPEFNGILNISGLMQTYRRLIPFALSAISIFFFVYFDRILISYFASKEVYAEFSYTFDFWFRLSIPINLLLTICFPYLCSSRDSEVSKGMRLLIFGFGPWIFLVSIFPVLGHLFFEQTIGAALPDFLGRKDIDMRLVLLTIGISIVMQRLVLAFSSGRVIARVYIASTILTTLVGAFIALSTFDAVKVLLFKGITELAIWLPIAILAASKKIGTFRI